MSLLILMRHGQSMWNAAGFFTGWVDVPLSIKGIDEAREGGKAIAHLPIDEVHVSMLIRAQMTAMIAMSEHNSGRTPVFQYSQEMEEGLQRTRLVCVNGHKSEVTQPKTASFLFTPHGS